MKANQEQFNDPARSSGRKKLLWALLGIAIVVPIIVGIVVIKRAQFKKMNEAALAAQQQIPPQPVNVAEAREESWQPRVMAVGSVTAVQGTVVSTEAEGVVREIRFEAGSLVKTGDDLLKLDSEVLEAQLRAR